MTRLAWHGRRWLTAARGAAGFWQLFSFARRRSGRCGLFDVSGRCFCVIEYREAGSFAGVLYIGGARGVGTVGPVPLCIVAHPSRVGDTDVFAIVDDAEKIEEQGHRLQLVAGIVRHRETP